MVLFKVGSKVRAKVDFISKGKPFGFPDDTVVVPGGCIGTGREVNGTGPWLHVYWNVTRRSHEFSWNVYDISEVELVE